MQPARHVIRELTQGFNSIIAIGYKVSQEIRNVSLVVMA